MAKTNKVIRSFNAGELSPKMNSRTDQAKYESGAKTMENFFPLIYGGATQRPGLEYIATQKDVSAKARSIDFEHSVDDTYNLVFENQLIRIFKDGDRVMNASINVSNVDTTGSTEVTVTTSTDHGYSTGDTVRFDGVTGTVEVNYNGNHATEWVITVVDETSFTLDGTDGDDFQSVPVSNTDHPLHFLRAGG